MSCSLCPAIGPWVKHEASASSGAVIERSELRRVEDEVRCPQPGMSAARRMSSEIETLEAVAVFGGATGFCMCVGHSHRLGLRRHWRLRRHLRLCAAGAEKQGHGQSHRAETMVVIR